MTQVMLWRRIDLPGHELARLDTLGDGWRLSGTAVFSSQQGPTRLDYAVICDSAWWTQSAHVAGTIGPHSVDIAVSVSRERTWYVNRVECRKVAACVDIDLGFSPSTNLLPIRRLALAVGEEAEVRAAWLPFPSLRFEPLSQLYRHEEERTWRYESGGGAFLKTLAVNATGFVTSYPELWEAEAVPSLSKDPR
jgi:uncharacterized protein